MSLFSFFITFAVSWWIILFMLLPMGVQTQSVVDQGHASSAPKKPLIWQKMLWATVLSALFSLVFLYSIDAGYFDFLDLRNTDWMQ